MAQKPVNNSPITNVCIVSDPQKCPPSYELLLKSKDKDADCDLWRDSNMFKKTTRYLCFSKAFKNQDTKVLASIQIHDRENPPAGFTILEKTIDSEERALKKKHFCVKYADRNSLNEAISDILLLTKQKRAPEGYTLVGDLNGLLICAKISRIPPEMQSYSHSGSSPANGIRPAPAPPIAGYSQQPIPIPRLNQSLNLYKNDMSPVNALMGLEFQINSSILVNTKPNMAGPTPSISFRSLNDIENEYDYSFSLERSFLQKTAA